MLLSFETATARQALLLPEALPFNRYTSLPSSKVSVFSLTKRSILESVGKHSVFVKHLYMFVKQIDLIFG